MALREATVGKFTLSSNCGFGDGKRDRIQKAFKPVCSGSRSTGVIVEGVFVPTVL